MSISGVSGSDFFQTSVAQAAQNKFQQIQSLFQKVGQDLQSGNLTQAQSDFTTLSQDLPSSQASARTSSAGPVSTLAKAFQTLGQDITAGNLTAAQQDFAAIQQGAQQQQSGQASGHHHHHGGASREQSSALQQAVSTLGTALQSGNLSSAQQAYLTLQADVQQVFPNFNTASGGSGATSSSSSTSSGPNVTA